jgi:protein-S-isoprenylcysteine O-methyltransferase Ste14
MVVLQSVHMLEHVAQVVQKFGLGMREAHGLLGAVVDREVVHLTYNVSLFAGMAMLVACCLPLREERRRPWVVALAAATALQGYHVVEHAVKFQQFLATGHDDTPGILGQALPLIWVHFTINLLVLAGLAASYAMWRRAGGTHAPFPRTTRGRAAPA